MINRNEWVAVYSMGVEDICLKADEQDNLYIAYCDSDGALEELRWLADDSASKIDNWMKSHRIEKSEWANNNTPYWESSVEKALSSGKSLAKVTIRDIVKSARSVSRFNKIWC